MLLLFLFLLLLLPPTVPAATATTTTTTGATKELSVVQYIEAAQQRRWHYQRPAYCSRTFAAIETKTVFSYVLVFRDHTRTQSNRVAMRDGYLEPNKRCWWWCLVFGGWCLVVGVWWLVVGGWWLVVGGWWLLIVDC